MSNYAIMRFQKYKLGSVANIERHQTLDEWHRAESERLEKELIEMANNVLSDEKEIAPQSLESDIFDELR